MDPNDQPFDPFPPPELASPVQTFHDADRSQSLSQTEALQGIQQDGGLQHPHLPYPLSVSFPGLETNTEPTTPLLPSANEEQFIYGLPPQNQMLAVSSEFPSGSHVTSVSPTSAPATRPLNFFPRHHNQQFGNYVTAADIMLQMQTDGQQYQYPAPQTAYTYAGPIEDTGLRTRSLSDSGYLSRVSTGQSANASHYENTTRMPLTPQARTFNQNLHPAYSPDSHLSPLPSEPVPHPKPKKKRKQRKVFCDGCSWEGRCESERKKHIQQKHTKPYVCNIGDCPRSFGSSSDRRRHQLSCHPTKQTPKFKCFANKTCAENLKTFNRKDNFTSHLEKTHKLNRDEIREQLRLSNQWLFNFGRSLDYAAMNQGGRQQSASLREESTTTNAPQPHGTASLNANPPFEPGSINPPTIDEILDTEDGPEMTTGLGDDMESYIKDLLTTSSDLNAIGMAEPTNYTDTNLAPLSQNGDTSALNQRPPNLSLPKSEYSDEREHSLKGIEANFDQQDQQTTTKSVSGKERYQCKTPGCNKSCKMPSLLRKHYKRHSKPYGCTFKDCYKIFGSKADWKRHESARHPHLERWRCGDPDIADPSRDCARMFERKNSYEAHLKTHGVYNKAQVQQRLDTNKLGGDCQFRFWCGFCKALIPVTSEAFGALTERFDHIYKEHFEKGQDIFSWVLPDSHLTKGEAKRRAKEKDAISTGSTTRSESVDSRLPDDDQQGQETATPSQSSSRQIRTFPASSRGRRSRASKSPPVCRKRGREPSRSTSESPSTTAQEMATGSQPQNQSHPELASFEELGGFNFSEFINYDYSLNLDPLFPPDMA